jgi:bifunctional UDP-N-acetylglucosamine pyrophosphorylase/glucosamine-1-phosphate N-acetyltransferase
LEIDKERIIEELQKLSDAFDPDCKDISIILAAGHGKRIKSEKSKMLHEIWGKPSVWRVCQAALEGLESSNQIVVVGIKALEVAQALGKSKNRIFVYQEEQRGTGDAVRTAIEHPAMARHAGDVFIFPGDMGLLTADTVHGFKRHFKKSGCNMTVMTGSYEGKAEDNYYGRIIKSREKEKAVIEIKEFKDILALKDNETYTVSHNDQNHTFTREELLNIREFNTGVYAFKIEPLREFINHIKTDNVQGEIYVTDLIKIFNDNGHRVLSSRVRDNNCVVAFNVKSVLKEMDETFRKNVYDQLKDIITIDDPDDFFIAEETIQRILKMDKKYPALDIKIGKGVSIWENVHINRGLKVEKNSLIRGNVYFGENVEIGENVIISTHPGQRMETGNNVQIFRGNVLKGQLNLGNNVRIETGVRITGSYSEPVIIGNNVLIKGTTYIYGSIIEDNILIQHSILINMFAEKVVKRNGEIQPIKYILPHPEGLDSLRPLSNKK